jgi:hypothetical protein
MGTLKTLGSLKPERFRAKHAPERLTRGWVPVRVKKTRQIKQQEHDPEKWIPVFRKDHAQSINWRVCDSIRSERALSLSCLSLVALVVALPALAQSPESSQQSALFRDGEALHEGASTASFAPTFRDGKLNACRVDYSAVGRDAGRGQDGLFKVSGSFGLVEAESIFYVVLNVAVVDIDTVTRKLTPNVPINASFVGSYMTPHYTRVAQQQTDTPGGLSEIFNPSVFPLLAALIDDNKVILSFNRRTGAEIAVPVDLTSTAITTAADDGGKKTVRPRIADEFFGCARLLAKDVGIAAPHS